MRKTHKFTPKPLLLMILDGFGYSEKEAYNAVIAANIPNWRRIWSENPHCLIGASGLAVGLPDGQMGNSEVGHLNLGAGRVVYQEYTRVSKAIVEGKFFQNLVLSEAMDKAIQNNKSIHIMGLLSEGGVHSHQSHIKAALEMAIDKGASRVYLHAFMDGRDTPPQSAESSLVEFETFFAEKGKGQIASIVGRYYSMDRDNRWDRIEKAYQLIAKSESKLRFKTASEALKAAYERKETDEFVQPSLIAENKKQNYAIQAGDMVLFMNFRADRARELSHAFCDSDFEHFKRGDKLDCDFVTLTHYANDIEAKIAFDSIALDNVLGEYLATLGLKQLRMAETEKYAHVTFFFNGGKEKPFPGESRELIPSPQVATYDLQPGMNADLLTDKLIAAIKSRQYDVIICNYANPDMVGHTGNFEASIKALEALDLCLARVEEVQKKVGGETLITADHGNVEKMFDEETQQPRSEEHTSELQSR